ncbi:hypothetical protein E2320_019693, partial [Naja naja]
MKTNPVIQAAIDLTAGAV